MSAREARAPEPILIRSITGGALALEDAQVDNPRLTPRSCARLN